MDYGSWIAMGGGRSTPPDQMQQTPCASRSFSFLIKKSACIQYIQLVCMAKKCYTCFVDKNPRRKQE